MSALRLDAHAMAVVLAAFIERDRLKAELAHTQAKLAEHENGVEQDQEVAADDA